MQSQQVNDVTVYLTLGVLVVASTIDAVAMPATVLMALIFLVYLYQFGISMGWWKTQ